MAKLLLTVDGLSNSQVNDEGEGVRAAIEEFLVRKYKTTIEVVVDETEEDEEEDEDEEE